MAKTIQNFHWVIGKTFPAAHRSHRCGQGEFLGVPKPSHPRLPVAGEGPCRYGLHHPGCTDCLNCDSMIWEDEQQTRVMFISVDFAADVVTSSDEYRTTQENLAHVVFKKRRPDLVVVNAGLHDMSICDFPPINGFEEHERPTKWPQQCNDTAPNNYKRNLYKYMQLMRASARSVLFIETTYVEGALHS